MNVPGLIKIEYIEKSKVFIPTYPTALCYSSNFSGSFTEMKFVPTTGGFNSVLRRDEKGNLYYETLLQFFIAEPTVEQKDELIDLSGDRRIYRVMDGQGQKIIIGDQLIPASLTFNEQLDPAYIGKRGYVITVICNDLHGPLIYTQI
jgi:hypothetical protein